MINFKCEDNCETQQLDIWDNSTEFDYQKAIIKIDDIQFKKEINQSTNPRLIDFLNPNLNTKLSVDVKDDGLVKVDYYLFKSVEAVIYEVGSNIVAAPNIYNSFIGFDYIYLDDVYEIDKSKSSTQTLFLKQPVKATSSLYYKGKKATDYVAYLCNTKKEVTKRVLKLSVCKNCGCEYSDLSKSLIQISLMGKSNNITLDNKKAIVKELLNRYGTGKC